MSDILVGTVAVGVIPTTKGFPEILRANLVPSAANIGQEIGRSISSGIVGNLGDPLGKWSDEQTAAAPARGAKVAQSYADAYRATIEAALKDLPSPVIGADATPADRVIANLRTQLEEIAHSEIGVDLSSADALTKIDVIKQELAELRADPAHVAISANIDEALTRIDTLRGLASRPVFVDVSLEPGTGEKLATELAEDGAVAGRGFGAAFGATASTAMAASGAKINLATSGITKNLEGAGGKSGGIFASLFTSAAGKGIAVGGLAVGAGLVASIKVASDYQENLTRLVTAAGESEDHLKVVTSGIKTVSEDTGESLKNLTDGMFLIESAGFHGADGLKVLKSAAEGAQISGADLGKVADATTTIMNDFHLSADKSATAVSFLNSVVSHGKTNLEDLAGSASKVLPTASALGVKLGSVGGALATLTGAGVSARLASQGVNSAMLALAAPSTAAQKAMAAVGLSSEKVGNDLTHKGILPAIRDITDAAGKKFPVGSAGYVAAIQTMIGGARGLSVALQLTGSHLSTAEKNTRDISKAVRSASDNVSGWEATQKDFNVKMDEFRAHLVVAAETIGQKLLPYVTRFLDYLLAHIPDIIAFGKTVGRLVLPGVLTFFKGLGDVIHFFSTGPMATVSKVLLGIAGALGILKIAVLAFEATTPFGWVAIAISGIILLIGIIDKFHKQILGALMDAFNWIKEHWKLLALILLGPFGPPVVLIGSHIKQIIHFVSDVIDFVKAHWQLLAVILLGPFGIFAVIAYHQFQKIKTAVLDTIGFVKEHWKLLTSILLGPFGAAILQVVLHFDQIKNVVLGVISFISEHWKLILSILLGPIGAAILAVVTHLGEIRNAFATVIAFVTGIWSAFWNVIKGVVGPVFAAIGTVLRGAFDVIKGIFLAFLAPLRALWSGNFGQLATLEAKAMQTIKNGIETILKGILDFFKSIVGVIVLVWQKYWDTLKSLSNAALGILAGLFRTAMNGIQSYVKGELDIVKTVWSNFWGELKSLASGAFSFMMGLAHGFASTFEGVFRTIVSTVKGVWQEIQSDLSGPVTWVEHNVIGKIDGLINRVAGFVGLHPGLPTFAQGGVVPGRGIGDRQLIVAAPGERVLTQFQVNQLGGHRAIDGMTGQRPNPGYRYGIPNAAGGIAVPGVAARPSPGQGDGGGLGGSAGGSGSGATGGGLADSILGFGKKIIMGALVATFKPALEAAAAFARREIPEAATGYGRIIGAIPQKIVDGTLTWMGKQDAVSGSGVGSGSGAAVASYARGFGTGLGHPYVLGGAVPSGWDCSGFAAWVYEKFGYFPSPQGTRFGTSESQFADSHDLQSSGAVPGALAFFDDGVFANPGHVGVVLNSKSYVSAADPEVGTIIAPIRNPVGFRIPKGGFITESGATGGMPANASGIYAYLAAHGMNKAGAAGVLGNILQESGGRPNIPGGLIQITGDPGGSLTSDLKRVLAYINANGSVGDINRHSPNPRDAALYFMNVYERPAKATENAARRIAGAEASFAHGYAKGVIGAPPGWAWVGEQGPELMRFRGGEDVMPNRPSVAIASQYANAMAGVGFASGTPGIQDHIDDEKKNIAALAHTISELKKLLGEKGIPAKLHSELDSRLKKAEAEKKAAESHLVSLEKQKAAAEKRLADAQSELKTVDSDISAIKTLMKGAPKAELADLKRELAQRENRRDHIQDRISDIRHDINGVPVKHISKAGAGEKLLGTPHHYIIDKRLDHFSQQIAKYDKQIEDDKTLLGAGGLSKAEKDKLSKDIKHNEAERKAAKEHVTFLQTEKSELAAYRTKLTAQETTIARQIASAKDLQHEKGTSKEEIKTLQKLIAKLEGQLAHDKMLVKDINDWIGDGSGKGKGGPVKGKPPVAGGGDGGDDGGGDDGSGGGGGDSGSGSTATTPPGTFIGAPGTVTTGAASLVLPGDLGLSTTGAVAYALQPAVQAAATAATSAGATTLAEYWEDWLKTRIGPEARQLFEAQGSHSVGLFDDGGLLMPGAFAHNQLSRPEPILTPDQWNSMHAAARRPGMDTRKLEEKLDSLIDATGQVGNDVGARVSGNTRVAAQRSVRSPVPRPLR